MRELPPLFIIPGLTGSNIIRELANQLLYPVFLANLPYNSMDIQEMAETIAEVNRNKLANHYHSKFYRIVLQKIRQIYPKGPYNIIGISWGGALAIEVTKILEKTGVNTLVYFLDGSPETIQAALKHLGDGVNAEVSLLTRVLGINNADVNYRV